MMNIVSITGAPLSSSEHGMKDIDGNLVFRASRVLQDITVAHSGLEHCGTLRVEES